MGFRGYAKPIVAVMPRLNENNVQFIMDEYLERTDGKEFEDPSEIYGCFEKCAKRRGYDCSLVPQINAEIEQSEDKSNYTIILNTEDLTGWFEFNVVIRISRVDKGLFKSEAIYLYVPSEFVSFMDTYTIDTSEVG